jgi:hypothetical protein
LEKQDEEIRLKKKRRNEERERKKALHKMTRPGVIEGANRTERGLCNSPSSRGLAETF